MNMNLEHFLSQVKSEIKSCSEGSISSPSTSISSPSIFLCLGNEAADADSIISSLCYGYLKHQQQHYRKHKRNAFDDKRSDFSNNHQYIPIVSIERNEMSLRQDVNILLQTVGLKLDDLICIDEIPTSIWHSVDNADNNHLAFALLDHNTISNKVLSQLPTKYQDNKELCQVLEILDHHVDGNCHLTTCSNTNSDKTDATHSSPLRNIAFDSVTGQATVASTCTLIVEKFFYPLLQSSSSANAIDTDHKLLININNDDVANMSILLMGVIALDTLNMDSITGRGTSRDQQALDVLENIINAYSSNNTASQVNSDGNNKITSITALRRNALYEKLKNAKMDPSFWLSLSAYDALRLDYKVFETTIADYANNDSNTGNTDNSIASNSSNNKSRSSKRRIGISSILLSIESLLLHKSDVEEAIVRYFTSSSSSEMDNNSNNSNKDSVPIDLLVIMSVVLNNNSSISSSESVSNSGKDSISRELFLCSRSETELNNVIQYLIKHDNNIIGLSSATTTMNTTVANTLKDKHGIYISDIYNQANVKMSRKQLAPLLTSYYNGSGCS